MSDIASTIRLNDQMSDPLKKISGNVERLVGQLEKMGATSKSVPDDTSKYNSMADSLNNLFVAAGGYKVVQLVGSAFSASAKAAIEFESAITGVYKTVDGTKEQLQGLSDAVKRMATEMPSTTTEIAAVMEASGQLGIATQDIERFTKTMIDLGNATNLTAEQAATSLAKFANITGMSAQDYDRLGAVIVDLGNNFATTEADIVNMSTYLTSAATVAGLAETDIMGLSAAMISMGINAEAGGSSMSKLISQMQTAVEVGGDDLKAFASVADMTAEEFTAKWGSDAVGALQAFIGGLNDVERNGKSMSMILQDMDLDDIRMSNMIKALASGSDTLTAAVSKANAAWEENTALTNEADKRYKTLDSCMQMLNNAFDNLKIAVGDSLTPTLGGFVDGLTDATNGLAGFAKEHQGVTAAVMGSLGAVGSAVGGFTALAPAITAVSTAAKALDITLSMSKIGLIIGGIAAAGAAIGAIAYAASDAKDQVEDYSGTLEECNSEIESTRAAHEAAIEMYGEESTAAQYLGDQLGTLTAQYEKGGGAAADYIARAKSDAESFEKIAKSYNERIDSINSEKTSALVMSAQLESLSGKANKTSEDLKLMGDYAERLNKEYQMDIVVNYDTGDVTGLDPDKFKDAVNARRRENQWQAASDTIADTDFVGSYSTQLKNYALAQQKLERDKGYWDELIQGTSELWNTNSPYSIVDSNGKLRSEFMPKDSSETYNYKALSDYLMNDANLRIENEKRDSELLLGGLLSWSNQTFSDEFLETVQAVHNNYSNLTRSETEMRQLFKDMGVSDPLKAAEGYANDIKADTFGSSLSAIVNSVKSGIDTGIVPISLDRLLSDTSVSMDTMTSAADEAEKANDAIKSSLTGMSEELMNTAQAYDEAYQAAYKSFSGQFGLFEDAEKTYKDAVSEIMKTNDDKADNDTTVLQSLIDNANTQKEYFDKITESLETISSVDLSKVGMTADEWDTFNDHMAELSSSGPEGAAGVNALADAIENGDWDKVKEAAKAYEDAKTASANASGKVAEEVSNVEQMMDKTQKAIENTLTNVGLQAPTAHEKAKSVVDQLAAGVSAGYDNLSAQVSAVESLMARLASFGVSAEAPKKSSTTTSAPSGGSTTTSTSVAKYHEATGTTSAFPGLTLVGENGPELIDMSGGEVVYNASQTAKMMEQIGGISRSLGMEHGIGSLDSYSFHTFDTPEEDEGELRLSDSDREYLIRLGERSAVSNATNNDIKIEMINNNNISNEADVDGIIDYLAKGLREALVTSAEGVHR